MRFNTVLPKTLTLPYQVELDAYQKEYDSGHLSKAWTHLERAHIIGQQYPFAHTYVHWQMLKFGLKIKSFKEVIGQIPRLLTGGIKSFVGKAPIGNPGGASVPPLKSFPIPSDLQEILCKDDC